jgi:hypothetical protein
VQASVILLPLFPEMDHNRVHDMARPVKGRTYSLFGNNANTHFFYRKLAETADRLLTDEKMQPGQLLDFIQAANPNRRTLKRKMKQGIQATRLSGILRVLHESLREYTCDIEGHLRSLPILRMLRDKGLFTTRNQYYLYMLEFELVNRVNRDRFLDTRFRIALLPYCLREDQDGCRADADSIDYRCRACLKSCYVNHVSSLLRDNKVEPYIWRRAKLKPLLAGLAREHGSLGVLGIACVVELVMGMRRCMKYGIPVIGIPLNANRCPRWMGELHDTSVDLRALERLLAP